MSSTIPLAERLRPQNLDDYAGQQHLVGKDGVFRKFIKSGILPSIILWGPPGVGKTTLAYILANQLKRPFYVLSAINSGVKDVREVIEQAKKPALPGSAAPLLFIDEIHRFSKSQQDSLLGAVEKGWITLIGATTENPSFEVIPALLSRCQVYVLEDHSKEDLVALVHKAIKEDEVLKTLKIELKEEDAMLRFSGGDARKLLNALETVVGNSDPSKKIVITNRFVADTLQNTLLRYDKSGEQHYDIISAFIKSIRGSDPNAAVYWLARMLEGGEDPKFIARRLLILSSEDIGNANPNALLLANSTFQAINIIGMPEARIILSQCAVYLASSPKSNASYMAINQAISTVRQTGNEPVPLHLRNAPTKLMKELNYGKEYQYSHDFPGNFAFQEFLPDNLSGSNFVTFGKNNREEELKNFLRARWKDKYHF
ncbi:MAG: replication-associated recombination protein A [Bacteroidota bacterium]